MRNRWLAGLALVAVAVVLAACGTKSSPADPATSSPAAAARQADAAESVSIKTASTSKGTVLTNADGRTLYWFAKDTAGTSNCTGSCATYWPPVMGTAVAAAGASLPHGFGTIKRANGQTQATYDGHPLYTYAGDTAPGEINGNGINASGGLWWAVTPSGAELRARASSSSGSGSGGGGW